MVIENDALDLSMGLTYIGGLMGGTEVRGRGDKRAKAKVEDGKMGR